MKKQIITTATLIGLSTTLYADDVAATIEDVRAFVLPTDSMTLRISYNRANDAVDPLNFNDTAEVGSPYSALGDSSGIDLLVGYGLHQFFSLYYNFEALNIHYAGGLVENRQHDLYTRINFYDTPHYSFDDFSMDVGYIYNSAADFNNMHDLSDNSFYFRLLLGSKFSSALLNFYTGFKYTSIDGYLHTNDIGRNEKSLMLGSSYTLEFSRYILDAKYEYTRIFDRESLLTENKHNHIFDINLAYTYHDNLLLYIGSKIMLNQFNGLIPYLYNTQTQAAFDKTYSLLKIGFVYNFNLLQGKKKPLGFIEGTGSSCQRKRKATSLFSFFGW
jgi:hypothetical protein